jgi:hypothetical protein
MSAIPTAAVSERKSPAVNRSNELLSCARTALKISQAKLRQRDPLQQPPNDGQEWLLTIDPASLQLHKTPTTSLDPFGAPSNYHEDDTPSQILLKDSTDLLAMLDGQLSELHSLVRRRGHTNDPTLEIQSTLEKFHEGVKEMKEVCASLAQEGSGCKKCMGYASATIKNTIEFVWIPCEYIQLRSLVDCFISLACSQDCRLQECQCSADDTMGKEVSNRAFDNLYPSCRHECHDRHGICWVDVGPWCLNYPSFLVWGFGYFPQ